VREFNAVHSDDWVHDQIREAYRPLQKAKSLYREVSNAPADISAATEARAALWRKLGRDVYPLPQEPELREPERQLLAGRITQRVFERACYLLAGRK
jgi:hypothetical protein